jgi:hypothetical protein
VTDNVRKRAGRPPKGDQKITARHLCVPKWQWEYLGDKNALEIAKRAIFKACEAKRRVEMIGATKEQQGRKE